MRFMVQRTSLFDRETPPCAEAYQEPYTRIDERTWSDPAQYLAGGTPYGNGAKGWYAEGRNHRMENGHIKRDFADTGWFVNIDSLEALLAFQAKYDRLVLEPAWSNPQILRIEIYDTWRE